MHRRRRYLLVVLGLSLTPLIAAITAGATAPDPRIAACGGAISGNEVSAAFDIPSAARIWDSLPSLGITPELERDNMPAFVVLFEDGYAPPPMNVLSESPSVLNGVVCVVQRDGTVNLYYDVSRAGFRLPN